MHSIREILVVEKDLTTFHLLQEALAITGLHTVCVKHSSSGKRVLISSGKNNPDIIVADPQVFNASADNVLTLLNARFQRSALVLLMHTPKDTLSLADQQHLLQDTLLKEDIDPYHILKTLQFSLERKRFHYKLEEANQRYMLSMKATNDVLWDANLQTGETYYSDRLSLYGYTEEDTSRPRWWDDHLHPDDRSRVLEKMSRHITSSREQWADSYRLLCANGSYRNINDRGIIIRDAYGKAVRIIGSMRDITNEVALREKLNEEARIQEQAILWATIEGQEKEKESIGRELHDNINQLLASIKLLNSAALTGVGGFKDYLIRANEVADLCIGEIRRMSGSLLPFIKHDISLAEGIDSIVMPYRLDHEIHFTLHVPEDVYASLPEQDQVVLYRVAQEALQNIGRYAAASEVNLLLSREENHIVLRIQDNGKGFDPVKRSAGIGLRNMRTRCEAAGGNLQIVSAPGEGCAVIARIPERKIS